LKAFSNLIKALDQTNKTTEKVVALANYFKTAGDQDKLWALALFTHRRPKRNVNASLLKQWVTEWAGIPAWLFQESYQVVGDMAETISLLLPPNHNHESSKNHSLTFYIEELIRIGALDNIEKESELKTLYSSLSRHESFVFTKLMTGGWRLGVSQNLVSRAISEVYAIDKAIIAHKLMGDWRPQDITFNELIIEELAGDQLAKPYPFYLAHPISSQAVFSLPEPSEWQAEWKWDGIRGQIINRDGQISIWSRGEELITDKFPELMQVSEQLPSGTVIDGEILPFKDGIPLPFASLQTRIGRKNLTKKILEEAPVIFVAYDVLEIESQDIRHKPLAFRQQRLAEIVALTKKKSDAISLSEPVDFNDWEALRQLREKSRAYKTEGFMLKKKSSAYEVGRKKGHWWKWKIDPLTIDGVMIYAQKGHGRRAGLYSDFTFAVWDGDKLVPFAKAYSGLTDVELKQVDAFVKKNIKEKFGPVRTVEPSLVFEIAFEGINESKRHKSGIALRFPRISRWRKDKPISEANSLQELQELLKQYG
jgi:DNA ligase-1